MSGGVDIREARKCLGSLQHLSEEYLEEKGEDGVPTGYQALAKEQD